MPRCLDGGVPRCRTRTQADIETNKEVTGERHRALRPLPPPHRAKNKHVRAPTTAASCRRRGAAGSSSPARRGHRRRTRARCPPAASAGSPRRSLRRTEEPMRFGRRVGGGRGGGNRAPWRAVMVAPCAIVNQRGSVASADAAEMQAVSRKTPRQPARCCRKPSGRPATAPPTCGPEGGGEGVWASARAAAGWGSSVRDGREARTRPHRRAMGAEGGGV